MTDYACAICLTPVTRGMLVMYFDGRSKLIALCDKHMESERKKFADRGVPTQDARNSRLN